MNANPDVIPEGFPHSIRDCRVGVASIGGNRVDDLSGNGMSSLLYMQTIRFPKARRPVTEFRAGAEARS